MEAVRPNSQTHKMSLTWEDVQKAVAEMDNAIQESRHVPAWDCSMRGEHHCAVFGVPRGGTYIALLLMSIRPRYYKVVDSAKEADIIVDDIFGTGSTEQRYPTKPFYTAYRSSDNPQAWLEFPWERASNEQGPEDNVRRMLQYIGEDPQREGLLETPSRVVKSWDKLFGGYRADPKSLLKVFKDDSSNEMVVLRDIEFYSTCEHHLLPFFGKAHIAYIPNGKVVGISKLARVLECYARRLQIQERLCQQITKLLDDELNPKGSACVLEAQHFCMVSRGVEKQNSKMVTSSLTGVFSTNPATRAEFLHTIRS